MQFSTTAIAAVVLQQVAALEALELAPALAPYNVVAATPTPTAAAAANVHDVQRRGVIDCLTSAVSNLHVPTPPPALANYLAPSLTGDNPAAAGECMLAFPASLSSEAMNFASSAAVWFSSMSQHQNDEPAHCGTSVELPLSALCTSASLTYVFTSASATVTSELLKQPPAPSKIVISDAKESSKSAAVSGHTYSAGVLAGAVVVALGSMML